MVNDKPQTSQFHIRKKSNLQIEIAKKKQLPKVDHMQAQMKINNLVGQMDVDYQKMLTPKKKNFEAG